MRAINHALTGAAIGLSVSNPGLAIGASIISHFALDALPHHGAGGNSAKFLKSNSFTISLAIDALLCVVLVFVLGITQPHSWLLAALCAFLATAPDLLWLPGWLRARKGGSFRQSPNAFMQFAARIQWFEKPIGGVVEVAWFGVFVAIIITYL